MGGKRLNATRHCHVFIGGSSPENFDGFASQIVESAQFVDHSREQISFCTYRCGH